MKHLYQTPGKKEFFGFSKRIALTMLVLLLSFASFSQTGSPFDAPATPVSQDNCIYRLSFYATIKNDAKVVLNWVMSSERPASHFIVQRSTDGNDFNDAAILFTDNNSHPKKYFRYADNISALDSGLLYYRIKTVGLDGKTEYSKVKTVRIEKKMEELEVLTINEKEAGNDMVASNYPGSK